MSEASLLDRARQAIVRQLVRRPSQDTTFRLLVPAIGVLTGLSALAIAGLITAFAIVRRATKRSGVATADKEHLHHLLIAFGHSHRRAVLVLWYWSALLAFAAWAGDGRKLTQKTNNLTLADARVAESNVTQHQAALSITESQISDFPAEFCFALSDETSALTTGTAKTTMRIPYAMTVTGVSFRLRRAIS